jgi:shikimate dehydrogenase
MAVNIDGKTKAFGILGFPVKHSFSPAFQNAAFRAKRINAVYAPFEVPPERLRDAVRGLAALGICGVNVTIPHKQAVLPLLDELSPGAKAVGAVNTVIFKNGRSIGYNTDAEGLLISLKKDLKVNPKNKNIMVFGSGGAAKAIAYVLAREKAASITFADICGQRAKELSRKIGKDFPGCRTKAVPFLKSRIDEEVLNSDILINASPVGMRKADPCIVSPNALHKGLAVYDIVYNPPATPLLREAKRRKIESAGGIGMLLYQGAASFELFTGVKAPVAVMRAALKKVVKG